MKETLTIEHIHLIPPKGGGISEVRHKLTVSDEPVQLIVPPLVEITTPTIDNVQVKTRNYKPVFKEEDVLEVRRLIRNGMSQRKIAQQYGVGKTTIGDIARGETWKEVY